MKRGACLVFGVSALLALSTPPAKAHTGFGMVVDAQGRVVFLDGVRSIVWRLEADGKLTALAIEKHANTLVQDDAGNLYVQNFNATLWKIAPDGKVTEFSFSGGPSDGSRRFGSLDELLAVDREGNLYFGNGNDFYPGWPQILRLSPRGEYGLVAGSSSGHADGAASEARFTRIRAAAWGPDGSLYVADENSVRRVAPDRTVSTLAGSSEAGDAEGQGAAARFHRVFGIAVDGRGNVYIADSDNFCVRRITPDGRVTTVLRTRLPWKPAGVAAAGDAVYVMERQFIPMPFALLRQFDTHRIRRIAPDRGVTTVARVGEGGGYVAGLLVAGAALGVWALRRWRRTQRRREATEGGASHAPTSRQPAAPG